MDAFNANGYLTYTTKQGSRVSWFAQTDFAAFGKGAQLISKSPFAETEQLCLSLGIHIDVLNVQFSNTIDRWFESHW